jgi:trk system potassium uptake protein
MRFETQKILLKETGNLLVLMAPIFIIPAIVSIIYSEWYSLYGFILSAIISSGTGLLVSRTFRSAGEPQYNNIYVITAFGWLMLTLVGGLPFYIIAHITPAEIMQGFVPPGESYTSSLMAFKNPLHCIFESMSGYTTTGLTMVIHEPSVGHGLLFYRSFSQWVGGAGFIILAIAVLKQVSDQSAALFYKSESFGDKLTTRVKQTARGIWKSYLIVTLLSTLYLITGTCIILPDYPLQKNIFDSINHAMSGLSSGGFSTLDNSIASYQSAQMDFLYILPMMLGSFSLPFYYRVIYQRKFSQVWKDIQTRYLIYFFIAGGLILSLLLKYSGAVLHPWREGVFQFISAISTTGWQTSDIYHWDTKSLQFIIFAAMFIGGASGGTVGGIKMIRAIIIQRGIKWQINNIFLSKNTVKTMHFNGRNMMPQEMDSELAKAASFALIFLLILFSGAFFSSFFINEKYSFSCILFESIAAQSTAGLSVGITDPSMHPVVETIFILQMWIGRLEIFPILALIRAIFLGMKPRKI